MKTAPIFVYTPPEDALLHSMVYPEDAWEGKTVIDWYLDFWQDAERVRDFFEENAHLLATPFWQERKMTRTKAIRQVYKEAKEFFFKLHDLHLEYQQTNTSPTLHDLFKLLHKNERGTAPYRYKAKPWDERFYPMLRLYSIKLDSGQMLVTGGGIKLTENMQAMVLLEAELERIDQIKRYIQNKKITCIADFLEDV